GPEQLAPFLTLDLERLRPPSAGEALEQSAENLLSAIVPGIRRQPGVAPAGGAVAVDVADRLLGGLGRRGRQGRHLVEGGQCRPKDHRHHDRTFRGPRRYNRIRHPLDLHKGTGSQKPVSEYRTPPAPNLAFLFYQIMAGREMWLERTFLTP